MTYEHTRLPRRAAEVIDAVIADVRKAWPRDGAEGEGVHALIDEIEYLRADLAQERYDAKEAWKEHRARERENLRLQASVNELRARNLSFEAENHRLLFAFRAMANAQAELMVHVERLPGQVRGWLEHAARNVEHAYATLENARKQKGEAP